jgi:hypothetical protein
VGFQVSGRWVCEDQDGTQVEIGPGDIFDTPPGHDAWGEVLVTSATRHLTMDGGLEYEEWGAVELKGVRGTRTLYALRMSAGASGP